MFTPLPPMPTGIADYAYELLAGLKQDYNCTVVVDDGHRQVFAPPGIPVLSAAEYINAPQHRADLHIYHLGNNPDHVYMLPFISKRPGIVVLHDPSLHHLTDYVTVVQGDVDRYIAALAAEHGAAGRLLGKQFHQYQLRDRRMYYDMPMTRGIIGPSLGVVVHSKYAAVKVLARTPGAVVTVVPHQYSPPDSDMIEDPQIVRKQLEIPDDEVLFMSLGFVTRAKCIDRTLGAFAAIRDRLPPFKYVIVGEINKKEIDIEQVVLSLNLQDRVVMLDYVEEHRFFALAQAADIVINLRHPIGGETSGSMIRALGAGVCTVVIDRGPFAEIPEGAAARIPWGQDFDVRLEELLLKLARDGDLRRRIGQQARAFIARHNNLGCTIAGYKTAIAKAQSRKPPVWRTSATWSLLPPYEVAKLVRIATDRHKNVRLPLWFSAGIVPAFDGSPLRMLLFGGSALDDSLLVLLHHDGNDIRSGAANIEIVLAAGAERTADLIVILPDAAIAEHDPNVLLSEINRRLAFGGMLIWHIMRKVGESRHPLLQSAAGKRLLEAYGFRINASITGNVAVTNGFAPGSDAEERCWRAFKESETFASPDFPPLWSDKEPVQLQGAT